MSDDVETLMRDVTDTDRLYELLADSAGLGADEIDKAGAGKTLFARIWTQQKESVCSNKFVQLYIHDPNTSDATTVAGEVFSLLRIIPGINMAVVACLAVRIGLRALCTGPTRPEPIPQ